MTLAPFSGEKGRSEFGIDSMNDTVRSALEQSIVLDIGTKVGDMMCGSIGLHAVCRIIRSGSRDGDL